MKHLLLIALAATITLAPACKSKMEKKDQSLEEMQEGEGNPENYQPKLASADATPIYKKINDTTEMHLSVYYPENHHEGVAAPCIIYFFGGGFVNGSPAQFEEHCKYFASRGMVAISADYRVISRNKGNAMNCIYDAKSAVRYVREHAGELGINPNKVVVGGGSAGGMLAIECAINDPKWQDSTDNTNISCVPNALVLHNPVVNAEEFPFRIRKFKEDAKSKDKDSHAAEINPLKHVGANMPPAILFHGTADKMSSYKFVEQFTSKYKEGGGQLDLRAFEGQKHGFTAIKIQDGKYYRETLKMTDEFLISLGYLSGSPTVKAE